MSDIDVAETLVEEADAIGADLAFDANGDRVKPKPADDNGESD